MKLTKTITGRTARLGFLASAVVISVLLAACGANSGTRGSAAQAKECDRYPSKDIRLIVPYSAGGGFDAWARLLAPYIEKNLGGKGAVRVQNEPGGGGMRAINTIYSAPPDGSTIAFTEPGYIAVNQILGNVGGDFDLTKLTFLGQATADPQVFVVSADSPVKTIKDLAARPIRHAGQDISPIETITYDAYGVKARYILHEGTSDVVLAVRRGDADATVVSLSSILPFMQAGDVRPILFIGTEKITPDLIGFQQLQGVQTAAETGHPELNDVLEQHRVLITAPRTPGCIKDALADALATTLADPAFVKRAEEAGLRVVPATADEAATVVANTVKTFENYREVLKAAVKG